MTFNPYRPRRRGSADASRAGTSHAGAGLGDAADQPPGEAEQAAVRRSSSHARRVTSSAQDAPGDQRPISRAVDAIKIHGSGRTAVHALDGVSVDFFEGQFAAIMGPSGSGKSTLLHCLAGLDPLTRGSIYLGSTEVTGLDERARTLLRRDRIGFVFQSYNLVPTLSALENITLPLDLAGRKADSRWLDTVTGIVGLKDRLHHRPSELSGGEQQRVAVARALASRPSIIFADEPTGNLDTVRGAEILAFLRRAVDEFGQTVVMVTHDPGAASHAGRVVFLADGKIVDEVRGPDVQDLLDRMKVLGA